MQSAQSSIDRFATLEGVVDPIEWLTEIGATTSRIEDAVEARISKRLKAGGVLTVRLALATLPQLGIEVPAAALAAAGGERG
jgi:hypothetical protein